MAGRWAHTGIVRALTVLFMVNYNFAAPNNRVNAKVYEKTNIHKKTVTYALV